MTGPLYLARRSYRRRRMRDAARFLPVVGAALMVVPILWGDGSASQAGRPLGRDALYLFSLWLALVLAAFWLSRKLHDGPDDPAGAPGDELPDDRPVTGG